MFLKTWTQNCQTVLHFESFPILQTPKEKYPLQHRNLSYLIEFEIGLTLSKIYNLPKLNHIPHRDYPTPYYQKILQMNEINIDRSMKYEKW